MEKKNGFGIIFVIQRKLLKSFFIYLFIHLFVFYFYMGIYYALKKDEEYTVQNKEIKI